MTSVENFKNPAIFWANLLPICLNRVISATFTLDFCFLPSDKKIHPQIKAEREREREGERERERERESLE